VQAEDGIRDRNVTGVQTCALPISCSPSSAGSRSPMRVFEDRLRPALVLGRDRCLLDRASRMGERDPAELGEHAGAAPGRVLGGRSEERRVGQGGGGGWGTDAMRKT